jgi:hypothetical protein
MEKPVIVGEWKHIFNPNLSKKPIVNRGHWYTNDHCFVKAPDGTWHAYGIIGYKKFGIVFSWIVEQNLFHITSKSLFSEEWQEHDYALTSSVADGERFAWAPHVVYWNNKYYMYYAVGDLRKFSWLLPSPGKIHLAISDDGFNWIRYDRNPILSAPGYARDPMLLFTKNEFYMYYTCNTSEINYASAIAVKKSKDLIYWTGPKLVHQYPFNKVWLAGHTESPFVAERHGIYYLFTCMALKNYNLTKVYWSKDPEWFPRKNFICDLNTHASEIIFDEKEGWFISNTGWDKKGLYLARLEWKDL